jgi:lipopolysaccharide transport system ATP-binding protein
MYVRLAFAVAAHLEPELLIVDEVLAVGDSAFQKKCIGKMKDVSSSGRTILFVSHQLASVQSLCNKSFVLKNGTIDFPLSETSLCIKHYLKEVAILSKLSISERTDREGEGHFRFTNVQLISSEGTTVTAGQTGKDLIFQFESELKNESLSNISVSITIYNDEGRDMLTLANHISDDAFDVLKRGQLIRCQINRLPLTRGSYYCNVIAYKDGVVQDYVKEAFSLEIEDGDLIPTMQQSFLVDNQWSIY